MICSMKPILSVEYIEKIYGQGISAVQALRGVNFTVADGEFVAIMGASGSGKTTLLNILAGLDIPSAGSLCIDGQDMSALSGESLALFRCKQLGFVFQDYNLLDALTIEENIRLPLLLNGISDSAHVQKAMKLLGISELSDRFPHETSGGQQQRTAVARALVHEPSLILADEPSGNLDSQAATALLKEFRQLNENERTTIVMVTHDPLAASYADRVILLKDGQVSQDLRRTIDDRQMFYKQILMILQKMEVTSHV
jgi:putative ABC transport system ATP-binding protein